MVYSGTSNQKELKEYLNKPSRPLILRRTREDVLNVLKLPPKTREMYRLDDSKITQDERLRLVEEQRAKEEGGGKIANTMLSTFQQLELESWAGGLGISLKQINRVRQDTALAKVPHAVKLINAAIASAVPAPPAPQINKVVVYAAHLKVVDAICESLGDIAVRVTGETKQEDRRLAVERFQKDDEVKVFVGTQRSAGQGITLTAATQIIFVEFDWSPKVLEQAEDRCHRIGQTAPLLVRYLYVDGTLDEHMATVLVDKLTKMDTLFGGTLGVATTRAKLEAHLDTMVRPEVEGARKAAAKAAVDVGAAEEAEVQATKKLESLVAQQATAVDELKRARETRTKAILRLRAANDAEEEVRQQLDEREASDSADEGKVAAVAAVEEEEENDEDFGDSAIAVLSHMKREQSPKNDHPHSHTKRWPTGQLDPGDAPVLVVYYDFETTGLDCALDDVTQLAVDCVVVGASGSRSVATYSTLVHTTKVVRSFITNLTGITQADVASAPPFATAYAHLTRTIDAACEAHGVRDCVWVAHNGFAFDARFLARYVQAAEAEATVVMQASAETGAVEAGVDEDGGASTPTLPTLRTGARRRFWQADVLPLARGFDYAVTGRQGPRRHTLKDLVQWWGVSTGALHRADADVAALRGVVERMLAHDPGCVLREVVPDTYFADALDATKVATRVEARKTTE
jgi:SWI/SNF-related matrix-associated actin-dependent regulator 1 of chromatin subfamily A